MAKGGQRSEVKRLLTVLIVLVGGIVSSWAEGENLLGAKMDEVGYTLKGLRRATPEEAVELVQKAQVLMWECFQWLPAVVTEMEEGAAKKKATANYKRVMAESYRSLCVLELAYLSGDEDAIDEAIDLVKKFRKEGHVEFIEGE
ncbi:MAG: hypothetical protein AAGC74_02865 [Verrucomicrobiota bacterium]